MTFSQKQGMKSKHKSLNMIKPRYGQFQALSFQSASPKRDQQPNLHNTNASGQHLPQA